MSNLAAAAAGASVDPKSALVDVARPLATNGPGGMSATLPALQPTVGCASRFVPADVIDVGGGSLTRSFAVSSAGLQPSMPSSTVAKIRPTVQLADLNRRSVCNSSGVVHPPPMATVMTNSGLMKLAKHGNGPMSAVTNYLPASSSGGPSPKCTAGAVTEDHSSHVLRKPAPDGWRRSVDAALMNTRSSSSCHPYPPAPLNFRGSTSSAVAASATDLTVSSPYGYCQYVGSKKPCHQRCVSGFQFCIRHILKDNSAPYRSCAYVKLHNGKECRCRNAVLMSQKDPYCGTHLVALGLKEPSKRGKKPAGDRCSAAAIAIADVGVKVPYFPGLDLNKGDVGFGLAPATPEDVSVVRSTAISAPIRTVVNGDGPPPKVLKIETPDSDRPAVIDNSMAPSSASSFFAHNGWDSVPAVNLRKLDSVVVTRGISSPSSSLPVASSCTSTTVAAAAAGSAGCSLPSLASAAKCLQQPLTHVSNLHQSSAIKLASINNNDLEDEQKPEPSTVPSMRPHKRHISLRPKRRSFLSMGVHRHIPSVGRMCHLLEEIGFYQSDLFPLGLEPSDGEDEDEEGAAGVGQSSVDIHDLRACTSKSFNSVDLKLYVACRTLELQIKEWHVKAAVTGNILNSCASFPDTTAAVLEERSERRSWPRNVASLIRPCQFQILKKEDSAPVVASSTSSSPMLTDMLQSTAERKGACGAPCLPFSSRCLRHVADDSGQHLYAPCVELNCSGNKDVGFKVTCLSHKKDAATVEPSAATVSSSSVKCLERNNSTEVRSVKEESSSHDAQLSFASAVQDLGIEVSEVSEMLSSLPALCSFSALLESEFVRPEETTSLARDNLTVDQAYMSAADHNWADVEQFLLSEGYKANFSVSSPSNASVLTAGQQPPNTPGAAEPPAWAHCPAVDEGVAYTMYDSSSRQCDVYACNGVHQNGYDPFVAGCMAPAAVGAAGPPQLPDVHLVYTAACDQYYTNNNLADGGNSRGVGGGGGGYVGSRRFDSQ